MKWLQACTFIIFDLKIIDIEVKLQARNFSKISRVEISTLGVVKSCFSCDPSSSLFFSKCTHISGLRIMSVCIYTKERLHISLHIKLCRKTKDA